MRLAPAAGGSREATARAGRGDHSAGVSGTGRGTQRWSDPPGSKAAEHHEAQAGTNPGNGFLAGAFAGFGRHDANGYSHGDDGVHVTGTSVGEAPRWPVRLVYRGTDLLRVVDMQDALQGGHG